jgi:hypothetical protein
MEIKDMDKYEHLNLTALKTDGSFINCYQGKITKFGTTQIQKCNSKKDLTNHFIDYGKLLQKISDLSIEYFNDIGKDKRAEEALMTANTYISRITTIYLNQINQKLNELATRKNIRLAWYSIIGAIISIVLTIGVTLWQNCSSQEQKDDIQEIKININAIKQQNQQQIISDSIRYNNMQTSIDSIIKQNAKIIEYQTKNSKN